MNFIKKLFKKEEQEQKQLKFGLVMDGYKQIAKTREYLDYIEEHLFNVNKAFIELSEACNGKMGWVGDDGAWFGVKREVEQHDISKFSSEEFVQYRQKFFPVANENTKEIVDANFTEAFEHHKENNLHHHETIRNFTDIIHMVIDWTAMGYKFGDNPREYYESNKSKIQLDEKYIEFMYELFDALDEYRKRVPREDDIFYVRKYYY